MKKNILFKAPVLTHSGYGIHARQIARVLVENFPDQVKFFPTLWGNTGWILQNNEDENNIEDIMSRIDLDENKKYDLSLQLLLPDEWNTKHGQKNIGITAGVETDICPENWIECCNKMDRVVVPSEFTKETFVKSGNLKQPITVIPEETYIKENDIYKGNSSFEIKNNIQTKFNVLVFGQITGTNPHNDRKNIFFTIKELCDIFKNDHDFGIILKTNAARNTSIDKFYVENIIKNICIEIKKSEFPKIYLIHGNMTKNDMLEMYNAKSIKALVTLSRGEGFGLPILEAASANLPIVSVNWSGQLEFLNNGKFLKVDYVLKEIHESRIDNRIFIKGAKWAEYQSHSFKRKMKDLRSDYKIYKQSAENLGKILREKYSHEEISNKYLKLISEFL
jgi:glycosyltransferase involved in cell wall biosynthesis